MPPSLRELKQRHLLTPRRKQMMDEAVVLPEHCPGCNMRFELPPTHLHSSDDATWCHVPKLLPCLHTVSAAFLQDQVEVHEEVHRLLLDEGCKALEEHWAQLRDELKALEDEGRLSRDDLSRALGGFQWFRVKERKLEWLLDIYESWPETKRAAWLRKLLPPDRRSEVRCPECDQFWGVHQGGVDGLPNNYLVIQSLRNAENGKEDGGGVGVADDSGSAFGDGEEEGGAERHDLAYLKERMEMQRGGDESIDERSLAPSLSSQALSLEKEELKSQLMHLQHENAVLKSNMERTLLLHADRMTHGTVESRIQQLIDDTNPLISKHEEAVKVLHDSISKAEEHRKRVSASVRGHFGRLRRSLDEREKYFLDEVNAIVQSHLAPLESDLEARERGIQDGRVAVRLSTRCLEEEFDEDHLAEMEQPLVEKLEQVQRDLEARPTAVNGGSDGDGGEGSGGGLFIEFDPENERMDRIERDLHKAGAIITESPELPRRNDRRRLRIRAAPPVSSGIGDITFTVNAGVPDVGSANRRFHEDYEQYFIYIRGRREDRTVRAGEGKSDEGVVDDEKAEVLGCVEIISRTVGPKEERRTGFQSYGEENRGEVPVLRFTQDTLSGPKMERQMRTTKSRALNRG